MLAELHETSLIALLAIGFALALLFGLVASNLKVSPIVGYLIAGICVGPFTPGFVGDSSLASQLAEIGLHFSIKDLMSVRYIALPGAIAQILTATAIGAGMAHLLGWSLGAGLVFGLSLSVASTVVLLRAAMAKGNSRAPWSSTRCAAWAYLRNARVPSPDEKNP